MAPKRESPVMEKMIQDLNESATALVHIKQDLGKPLSRRERAKQVVSKVKERAKDQTTKTHRVAVDLGGGAIAQVSTEMLNWGIRSLADWSGKESWLKKNSDILQGAPHLMVGLAVYLTELLTRPKEKLPSLSREIASEAANVFTHLGFANLWRALRIRWDDGKVDAKTLKQVTAERDAAVAKLAANQGSGTK